jgi:hypothetical protein
LAAFSGNQNLLTHIVPVILEQFSISGKYFSYSASVMDGDANVVSD